MVRQEGEDGEIQQTYDVTYVDGVEESEKLINEVTTKIAIDQIIAVGPEKTESSDADNADNGQADSGSNDSDSSKSDKKDESDKKDSDSTDKKNDSSEKNDSTSTPTTEPTQTPTPTPTPTQQQQQTQTTTNPSDGCRLYHPSAAQAQTYAAGAAASMAGPDSIGPIWSNYGIVNPAGCGIRRTRHPERTAFRNPCQAARWPLSARTGVMTQPCRSIGA